MYRPSKTIVSNKGRDSMFAKLFKKVAPLAAVAAGTAVLATAAQAGTSGAEFQEAYEMLVGWIEGFFGRAMAVAFLLVGLFMGIARQNLMACGISIAVAFGLVITPTILDSILTATVSAETVAVEAEVAQIAAE